MREEYRKGLAEGKEIGLIEGEARMAERLNKLTDLLLDAGRTADLKKSASDPVYFMRKNINTSVVY